MLSALIATVLFTTVLTTATGTSTPLPNVGPNINVTKDAHDNEVEPHIAVDPYNSNHLVVGYTTVIAGYGSELEWSWSDDGGLTWSVGHILAHPPNPNRAGGYTAAINPVVAFDNAGNVYYCGLLYVPTSGTQYAEDGTIVLWKSNDGGHTFTAFDSSGRPKIIAQGAGFGPYYDKPWMCINPANNYIYIAYVVRYNAFKTIFNDEESCIAITHSTDGGVTFSQPIMVGWDVFVGTLCNNGPQIAVGSGGNVYVAWNSVESAEHTSNGWELLPPTYRLPQIWIAQSTDYGVTFPSSEFVAQIQHALPAQFISMGVDAANGRIYIAYPDRPRDDGDLDMYVASGPSCWGPWNIQRVNDDPVGNGAQQYYPYLSVSRERGRVDVIWWDYRAETSPYAYDYCNVYYTASTDGGNTWQPNTKVTSVSPGFGVPLGHTYWGDICGSIASLHGAALCVWMENTDPEFGGMEIFFAALEYPSRASAPVASFTETTNSPELGTPITFDASASYANLPAQKIVDYAWNFGDGATASGVTATHAYSSLGSGFYIVSLTVTDDLGQRATTTTAEIITVPTRIHPILIKIRFTLPIGSLPMKSIFIQGHDTNIYVLASNLGNNSETFNVTLYANAIPVGNAMVTDLLEGTSTLLVFDLNTTDLAYGNYTLSAYADVPGQTDTSQNNCTGGWVCVSMLGDVNGDYQVDMRDIGFIASCFGSSPGNARWNANADINEDDVVDLKDVATSAKCFGQHYP